MLVHIPNVLTPEQVRMIRDRLDQAGDAWVDGRATAGYTGAPVKRNQQIAEHSPIARELGDVILAAIERHPLFISAALPNQVYPPLFNRYEGGMTFGSHVDGAVRVLPNGVKLRTDVSVTLFLSAPDEYDGGELVIEDAYGVQQVKLPAGDMIVYPATSLHQVTPVTRGVRVASFFWVQSLVRSDAQRALLFDMDTAIQRLNAGCADPQACRSLVGCYHNLLRIWSEM
ncbi:Fe2+-dependent dioxygenase [Burkholderia multivorans]|uniref:Fe2+-dependent dioxygenase n=1 Tax=Burkholderia multivorans TaxID=87883 RepID=UPI001C23B87C|nr:Fe2+-dependent dioxygenase [Burkholderia multivorans]MBU9612651.1 Fe2+-dependent dioxygenase [Burkholderia multivorans]